MFALDGWNVFIDLNSSQGRRLTQWPELHPFGFTQFWIQFVL